MRDFNEYDKKRWLASVADDQGINCNRIGCEAIAFMSYGGSSVATEEVEYFRIQLLEWMDENRITLFDIEVMDYGHSDDWRYDNNLRPVRTFKNYKRKATAEKYAKETGGKVVEVHEYITY